MFYPKLHEYVCRTFITAAFLLVIIVKIRVIPATALLVSCLSPWYLGPLSAASQFQGCHGCRLRGPLSFSLPALVRNHQRRDFRGPQSIPEMMSLGLN